MRRQSWPHSVPVGNWVTVLHRTDDSTQVPRFSKRSRKVLTWSRRHPVRQALKRSPGIST